jgi:tripartite-type tricarboxylate transporter receptor subunit TctC
MPRRAMRIAIALLALGTCPAAPHAADGAAGYPARPVRLVVPFPAGASNDIIGRLVAQRFTEALGQQFVVDNRGGAGGLIGAETVARATPDGYTLILANPGPNINSPALSKSPTYRPADFAPIALLGYTPLILAAHTGFAPKNAAELLVFARANPGKVTWGSAGVGSSLHIGLALFIAATGVQITHVPYKGTAPALTDVVGGQINLMHTTSVSAEGHIKAGRVRVLGSAGPKRQKVLPDVPTLAEQGIKDAEALVWFGLAAPARVPPAILDRLNREANTALDTAEVRARMDQLGLDIAGGPRAGFAAFLQRESDRLANLIRLGIVKPE